MEVWRSKIIKVSQSDWMLGENLLPDLGATVFSLYLHMREQKELWFLTADCTTLPAMGTNAESLIWYHLSKTYFISVHFFNLRQWFMLTEGNTCNAGMSLAFLPTGPQPAQLSGALFTIWCNMGSPLQSYLSSILTLFQLLGVAPWPWDPEHYTEVLGLI